MLEEHILEVLGNLSTAASTSAELVGNLVGVACGAVNFNDAGQGGVLLEGNAIGVEEV